MPIVEISGRRVEYLQQGSGDPVVLSSPSWWPLDAWKISGFPELSGRYQVLAFNHRGIGQSDPGEGAYTVYSLAEDLMALTAALDLPPAHVIGFAIGGAIAVKAALAQRKRVRSLVIAAAGAGAPADSPSPAASEQAHINAMGYREFIRHHALNDDFAFSPKNYARYPERPAALADALWEHAGRQEQFLKHAEARRGYSTVEGASRVDPPSLVLVGAEDTVARGSSTPVQAAQELAAALPRAELRLLPGVRHMTFWEQPDAAWQLAKDFLSTVPRMSTATV